MKTIITLLFICLSTAAFSQKHYTIPVEELDTLSAKDSSSFNHHPIQLDVDVNYSETSWDTLNVEVRTTFYENISNLPFYIAKSTYTASRLYLPVALDLKSTVNADKSYNLDKLNPILRLFGLKYRSVPVTGVNTKLY